MFSLASVSKKCHAVFLPYKLYQSYNRLICPTFYICTDVFISPHSSRILPLIVLRRLHHAHAGKHCDAKVGHLRNCAILIPFTSRLHLMRSLLITNGLVFWPCWTFLLWDSLLWSSSYQHSVVSLTEYFYFLIFQSPPCCDKRVRFLRIDIR